MKTRCPGCGVRAEVPDDMLGDPVECPSCGTVWTQPKAVVKSLGKSVSETKRVPSSTGFSIVVPTNNHSEDILSKCPNCGIRLWVQKSRLGCLVECGSCHKLCRFRLEDALSGDDAKVGHGDKISYVWVVGWELKLADASKTFFSEAIEGRRLVVPQAIACALLLYAGFADAPYGFYGILRWFVFVASLAVALDAACKPRAWLAWMFVLVATVYNPFARVRLDRETWQVVNIVTAALELASILVVPADHGPPENK